MSKNSERLRLESQDLLVQYYSNPTIQVRNRLVELNTGLVRSISHRISKGCSENYQDLEQVGYIGLLKAIERFIPQGNRFSTYAVPYIEGSIRHYLRDKQDMIKLPRRLSQLYKDGQKIKVSLEKELRREVSDLEIAGFLEISILEWREALKTKEARTVLSLDVQITQLDGCVSIGDNLPCDTDQIISETKEEYQFIRDLVGTLDIKLRQVIECVYFQKLTRKHVAKLIGVSPMTVSRRLAVALERMRELHNEQLKLYS